MHAKLLWMVLFGALAWLRPLNGQGPQDLVHKVAPEIVRKSLSGEKIDLKNFRGKVVLLNFWATWCAPCQTELPKFAVWQKKYGPEGLQVLAVSMDDNASPVRRASRRLGLDFPVMMGDAQLGGSYGGILGLPVTFLIDRKGEVTECLKGGTDLAALERDVRKLLESK